MISILITVLVLVLTVVIVKKVKDGADRGGMLVLLGFSTLTVVLGVSVEISSTERPDYTTTVNGNKYYCERAPQDYDASYWFPGWHIAKYNSDEALAVCYPLVEN